MVFNEQMQLVKELIAFLMGSKVVNPKKKKENFECVFKCSREKYIKRSDEAGRPRVTSAALDKFIKLGIANKSHLSLDPRLMIHRL